MKALIEQKVAKAYDEAVVRLTELRELADDRGEGERFADRVGAIGAEYGNRPARLERLRRAGLM